MSRNVARFFGFARHQQGTVPYRYYLTNNDKSPHALMLDGTRVLVSDLSTWTLDPTTTNGMTSDLLSCLSNFGVDPVNDVSGYFGLYSVVNVPLTVQAGGPDAIEAFVQGIVDAFPTAYVTPLFLDGDDGSGNPTTAVTFTHDIFANFTDSASSANIASAITAVSATDNDVRIAASTDPGTAHPGQLDQIIPGEYIAVLDPETGEETQVPIETIGAPGLADILTAKALTSSARNGFTVLTEANSLASQSITLSAIPNQIVRPLNNTEIPGTPYDPSGGDGGDGGGDGGGGEEYFWDSLLGRLDRLAAGHGPHRASPHPSPLHASLSSKAASRVMRRQSGGGTPEMIIAPYRVPNVHSYFQQFNLHDTGYSPVPSYNVKAEGAWGLTMGAAGITIAELDTGCYQCPDLNLHQGWDTISGMKPVPSWSAPILCTRDCISLCLFPIPTHSKRGNELQRRSIPQTRMQSLLI